MLRLKPAAEFLKNYSSNTPDKPLNAFIDLQGRIVATFYQAVLPADEALVVIESAFTERLLKHLGTYLKISGSQVTPEPYRVYFQTEGEPIPEKDEVFIQDKKGGLWLTRRELAADVTPEEFKLFRLRNRMPVQGQDYDRELLLNVDEEDFVSYAKGCYLGQEIIARVHYRAKPPKKLVVKREKDCSAEESAAMTSKAVDPASGDTLGFVFAES